LPTCKELGAIEYLAIEARAGLGDIAEAIRDGHREQREGITALVDMMAGVGAEIREIRKDIASITGSLLGIRRELERSL